MLDLFSADEDDWQKVAEVWCNQGSCGVSVAPAKMNGVQSRSWDHQAIWKPRTSTLGLKFFSYEEDCSHVYEF